MNNTFGLERAKALREQKQVDPTLDEEEYIQILNDINEKDLANQTTFKEIYPMIRNLFKISISLLKK